MKMQIMVYDVESRKTKKLNLNDSEKEFLFCENVNINDVWFLSNGYNESPALRPYHGFLDPAHA